jgi:hypothetical protein
MQCPLAALQARTIELTAAGTYSVSKLEHKVGSLSTQPFRIGDIVYVEADCSARPDAISVDDPEGQGSGRGPCHLCQKRCQHLSSCYEASWGPRRETIHAICRWRWWRVSFPMIRTVAEHHDPLLVPILRGAVGPQYVQESLASLL